MEQTYIDVTPEAGAALMKRKIKGPVVMLNMLKFRDVADYSAFPEIEPERPLSGREAFQRYIDHTTPYLEASGGSLVFLGIGGGFLIGPPQESWDAIMLVRQTSVTSFMRFASNTEYLAGMGHRTAALSDSRLMPITETNSLDVPGMLG